MPRLSLTLLFIIAALLVGSAVHAQKLYKIIDADGNIRYQDYPPTEVDVQFEEKQINADSKANTEPEPQSGSEQSRENSESRGQRRARPERRRNQPANGAEESSTEEAVESDEATPFLNPEELSRIASDSADQIFDEEGAGGEGNDAAPPAEDL